VTNKEKFAEVFGFKPDEDERVCVVPPKFCLGNECKTCPFDDFWNKEYKACFTLSLAEGGIGMNLEQNVKAVIESCFSESKEENQNIAVDKIVEVSKETIKKAISHAVLQEVLDYHIFFVDDVMKVIDEV